MISIVIPTKNEESVIEKTLTYLAAYSGEKEIIISDGGNTDRTIEIAKLYTDKIVMFSGPRRQTIAHTRNAGAQIAKGEFLVFLDADVRIEEPNIFFQRLLDIFNEKKQYNAITVKIRVIPSMATRADTIIFYILDVYFLVLNNLFHFGGASGKFQMIRREAFEKIGGFNEKLVAAEDGDLFQRLAKIGRTYFDWGRMIYHTGRRAHRIGWPKLLWQWNTNFLSVLFFHRSVQKEWEEIR